ncbi:hypothetical protein MKZ38_001937 [Zalerion maritima]|uniref:Uncharacterized protein n=1 Tax=Zalerion maritima TaxID=339359 RepID=A0AAD5RFB9_9PEZI|nr:hypothetical protein MKZ38_001937 [Zalerion maritima]
MSTYDYLPPQEYYPYSNESSPRSANSNIYSPGSDFSNNSSANSSYTSRGAYYINVNGRDVEVPRKHRRQRQENGEYTTSAPRPRHHRQRRGSTVIINTDEIPRSTHHSRNGSNTSHNSQGSAPRRMAAEEPSAIYIEENVGDSRPARTLTYDNRGRTRHRPHHSDGNGNIQINVAGPSRSRPRRRQRSASAASHAATAGGHATYWSDEGEEDYPQQRRQSSKPPKRRSSMKRPGRRSSRPKSVSFSPENEVIDIERQIAAIQLKNSEIARRPAVPEVVADAYFRPQVTAHSYTPADFESARAEKEAREEAKRMDRLRRRQEQQQQQQQQLPAIDTSRPPVARRDATASKKNRRGSSSVTLSAAPLTAPPMGVYNPYVSASHGGYY